MRGKCGTSLSTGAVVRTRIFSCSIKKSYGCQTQKPTLIHGDAKRAPAFKWDKRIAYMAVVFLLLRETSGTHFILIRICHCKRPPDHRAWLAVSLGATPYDAICMEIHWPQMCCCGNPSSTSILNEENLRRYANSEPDFNSNFHQSREQSGAP